MRLREPRSSKKREIFPDERPRLTRARDIKDRDKNPWSDWKYFPERFPRSLLLRASRPTNEAQFALSQHSSLCEGEEFELQFAGDSLLSACVG
jgi:hypothetical protein